VDRYERKRLLLVMFGLFALATLACGLAPGFATLLAARCLSGAFGGVLGAMVQTMVGDLIPFERRGRASGTIMSSFSLSMVAGVPFSLLLANQFGWRFPVLFIAVLARGFLILGARLLPRMRGHLCGTPEGQGERRHLLSAMIQVLGEANHRRALFFMVLAIFSGFTVIPYITIYLTGNVGVTTESLPLIYLVGGSATFFTSRLIGRLADRYGKVRVYRTVALLSMVPLFIQTHLRPVPLWVVLLSSTLFFILVPGRMVPAMAIVTSAVQSRLRGTFLSLNGALQQLASGAASYLGGVMIASDAGGRIVGYDRVGYLAIVATLAAMAFVGSIRLHTGSGGERP
jgi:predicted MFS family arabinose efflux permease